MTRREDMILIAHDGLTWLLTIVEQRVDAYAKLSNRSRILEPILLAEVWHAAGVCYGEQLRAQSTRKLRGANAENLAPAPPVNLVELALERVGTHTCGVVEEEILANALMRDFASYAVAFHEALHAVTSANKIEFLGAFQRISEHVHTTFRTASRNKRRSIRLVEHDTVRVQNV